MTPLSLNNFFYGLSGLQLPLKKVDFPEPFNQSSRLAYYSTLFNSIEINSSFYKLPQVRTLERWIEETTSGFTFTFKVWKEITHVKNLDFDPGNVAKFADVIRVANPKSACLLIQLPPSSGIENRLRLFQLIEELKHYSSLADWKIAVEYRNGSWYRDDIYDWMEHFQIGMVQHDLKKCPSPAIDLNGTFKYFRFHGPTGNYRGNYTEDFLLEYSSYLREFLSDGKTVYTYFNNTMGDAFGNCRLLNQFVIGRQ